MMHTESKVMRLFKEQGRKCYYCDKFMKFKRATKDHYIPKAKGGPDSWENIVIACVDCNKKKKDILPSEFMKTTNTQNHG